MIKIYQFNNDYQQESRALYTFIPNKYYGQLLEILPINFIFSKTFNSEFFLLKCEASR